MNKHEDGEYVTAGETRLGMICKTE